MKTLQFTPLALNDLEGILHYISQERPKTARDVLARIRETCEQVRANPKIGQGRRGIRDSVRMTTIQRWVVFYRECDASVEILRVLDGARDVDTLLD